MEIEYRTAQSPELAKSRETVRKMTGRMGFDENIGRVNWRLVRLISGIGYRFMPRDKSVTYRRLLHGL